MIIGRIAQAGAALWILNVWFNRFDKDTGYRGGDATNMREEFEEYGQKHWLLNDEPRITLFDQEGISSWQVTIREKK